MKNETFLELAKTAIETRKNYYNNLNKIKVGEYISLKENQKNGECKFFQEIVKSIKGNFIQFKGFRKPFILDLNKATLTRGEQVLEIRFDEM